MFGRSVRAHRQRLGLSQEELMGRSGVGLRTIRDIETGRVRRPRPATVRLLADALGLRGADRERFHDAALRPEPGGPPAPQHVDVAGIGVARPAQLPADVIGFAGRTAYLRRLTALLPGVDERATAVVISAVSGTAGVGKTALAVHWAHQVADWFPDGQLYVNLRGFAPVGSAMGPADAVRGFLGALGVPSQRIPASLDEQTALYRSLLAGRRLLVLLDNARDPEQVRPLLPGASGCLVLVTSRSRLTGLVAAVGAHPLPLDLLPATEARELLGYRLGPDRMAAEPEATDEIITRCARLPLALAIVAASAASSPGFSLGTIARELAAAEGGLEAFVTGDTATDARAVFSWSYRSLSAAPMSQ